MANDLVKRLRADELPGDRQRQIEARIELWKILQEAADRIEQLEAALRTAAGYISTKEGHTDQHPQDVYNWLVRAALDAGAE